MKHVIAWIPSVIISCLWFGFHLWNVEPLSQSWKEAGLDAAIASLFILLISRGLTYMLTYYKPGLVRSLYLTLGNALLAWLVIELYHLVASSIGDHRPLLDQAKTLPSYLVILLIFVGFQTAGFFTWLNVILSDREQERKKRTQEEDLVRRAELNNLKQQLQPHFLFNSLNSIQALIAFDPAAASNMLQKLADFMRGSIQKQANQTRTLEEEIIHLKLYLDIEMIRFEDRLTVNLYIPEETLAFKIPTLLLQPLVENAIKHGLYGTLGKIQIDIHSSKSLTGLDIVVNNPIDDDHVLGSDKGTGFGLSSVARRLQLIYFRTDLVNIKREKNQFSVHLSIPQK